MSKPEDIPQDVWDRARSLVPDYVKTTIKVDIARAIMSAEKRGEEREREACARVAEEGMHDPRETARAQGYQPIPVPVLAAAIRKRGEA